MDAEESTVCFLDGHDLEKVSFDEDYY